MPPSLSNPVARIRRRLSRVRRRQVLLGVVSALGLGSSALGTGWALATLAANEGARSAGLLALVVGAATALGLAAWRFRPVHAFATDRAQAARLETVAPDLDGGLLTVLDRTRRPRGSEAGLARLAEAVAARVDAVPPPAVWPLSPALWDVRLGLLGLLLLALAGWRLPLGPVDALRSIFAAPTRVVSAPEVAAEGPQVVLGDITLQYLYPPYTRLETVEIPNTNGEVRAPRGTRVALRARTAEPQPSARFLVYDLPPEAVEMVEGRGVRGSFVVEDEGTWRFEFPGGSTPAYRIVPDPDLAPDVTTSLPARIVVTTDQVLGMPFAAKDDYGIAKVVVEVSRAGTSKEVVLREPVDWPRALDDAPALRVADLGLASGDVARLRVGAWDNDAVSGSKVGWSSAVELVVEGARGDGARRRDLGKRVVAALIPVLADGLLDPSPAAGDGPGAGRFAEQLDARYESFDDVVQSMGDLGERGILVRVVRGVSESRRELVAFARGLGAGALHPRDGVRLGVLQASAVARVEDAVYLLDKLERAAALKELLELVAQVAREAEELEEALPRLDRMQALSRLDQLERLYGEVRQRAEALERGGIKEFLEQRGEELDAAMLAARKGIAGGDDATARREMARVAQLLAEMAGGVQESMRRSGGDDETAKAMDALQAELQGLAEEQAALREETAQARDRHGQSLEEGMKAWSRVDQAVAEAQRRLAEPSIQGLDGRARSLDSALDDAGHDVQGLADSTRARDRETARDRAGQLDQALARARSRLAAAERAGQLSADEAGRAAQGLAAAQAATRSAMQELDRLQESQSGASPEMAQALRQLSGRQRELAERAGEAGERARSLEQSLPTGPAGVADATGEAAREAGRAGQEMQQGNPMATEGAQRAAEEALLRASEALQQARRDMQELARSGAAGGPEPKPGEPGDEEGQARGRQPGVDGRGAVEVVIPAPEEFETPEAYRKALLEGMQGDVPDAYRAAHRRYYEELVRQ